MLPTDPIILQSVINTKLRDYYSSLEALCEDMDEDIDVIKARLAEAGITYNAAQNKCV